jgi:hypothetical protein
MIWRYTPGANQYKTRFQGFAWSSAKNRVFGQIRGCQGLVSVAGPPILHGCARNHTRCAGGHLPGADHCRAAI